MADPPKHLTIGVTLTIGGVLVTLVLFLLPPKAPGTVAFCLLLLFLLPLYPIWIWCRTKTHTWPRVPAILLLAVIVLYFGHYVWPPNAPSFLLWLGQKWHRLDQLSELSWYWLVLSGCVLGFVLGMPLSIAMVHAVTGRRKQVRLEALHITDLQLQSAIRK